MSGVTGNKSKQGRGSLTEDQVRDIRKSQEIYADAIKNHSPMAVSKKTGISVNVIREIFCDRLYNWVI